MTLSTRERALAGLEAVLSRVAGAKVTRNEPLPQSAPAGGLLILRDGDPGDPEITLSPPTYEYDHVALVEAIVQAAPRAARIANLDELLRGLGQALAADQTLGGTVTRLTWSAARDLDDEAIEGASGLRGAVVEVTLTYSTTNPLL
ncbi:hypothetical protein N825_25405 [Skermanella stibiiresistens SB22]|uniref:Acyl-CoA transferase n=1 Tax=Skermanella stibiiresistens SB22 TaxID=1385369 RepID=W9GSP5_9PROT|nr:hypothetical protein [Skermanella stibiiresistens]EWY36774.1 hypothetical protein N825_25405 [Skermanella stibiiresistens SB22]